MSMLISSLRIIPEYLPFGSRNFVAASFIFMGSYLRNSRFAFYNSVCFVIIVLSLFWHTAIPTITYIEIIPYFIVATIGSWSIFSLCQKISIDNFIGRFLTKIGDITLNILTWHMLSFKVVSYMLILNYGLDISRLAEFPVIIEYAQKGWWVLYLFVGVIIPYSCYTINKWIHSKLT